jgi:hypothetical protein
MYWTLELASYLSDAPWPANKTNLLTTLYVQSVRSSRKPQSIEDEGEI